jgi:photosystem II stability/assembly factor-like uncharacterized protein
MRRSTIAVLVVAAASSLLALVVSIFVGLGADSAFAASRPFGAALQADYGMAVDGRDGLVVVNRSGVLRTVDGGATWTNITPRSIHRLVDHVASVIAIGPDIWLEMEGDERFGFLLYSRDGGRSWQIARIAGSVQMSNLVFENPRNGWVTNTARDFKKVQYRTVDGGRSWQRSGRRPKLTVPSTLSGVRVSTHGAVPAGLKVTDAVRSPGGLSWALASGPVLGSYFPPYLLRSTNGGQVWTTVPDTKIS